MADGFCIEGWNFALKGGIRDFDAWKIAPEADRYAPFLSIGKVSTERVLHEPITSRSFE